MRVRVLLGCVLAVGLTIACDGDGPKTDPTRPVEVPSAVATATADVRLLPITFTMRREYRDGWVANVPDGSELVLINNRYQICARGAVDAEALRADRTIVVRVARVEGVSCGAGDDNLVAQLRYPLGSGEGSGTEFPIPLSAEELNDALNRDLVIHAPVPVPRSS